jgi:hypothetical protein
MTFVGNVNANPEALGEMGFADKVILPLRRWKWNCAGSGMSALPTCS